MQSRFNSIKVVLVVSLIFLSGCGLYNLSNFTIPNDEEFIAVIDNLDTPEKICNYMEENFEHMITLFAYNPYTMWFLNTKTKAGDCNDFATWAMFVAHYHRYEVYLIIVSADYKPNWVKHALGVFIENGEYNYSSNWKYYPIRVNTFKEIVNHHIKIWGLKLESYKVYDYEMNLIEYGGY